MPSLPPTDDKHRKMYDCMFWESVHDYQQIKHFHLHVLQFIQRGQQLNTPESEQPTSVCANKLVRGKTTKKCGAGAADKGILIGILIGTRWSFSNTCFSLSLGTRNHGKVKTVTSDGNHEVSITSSPTPCSFALSRIQKLFDLGGGDKLVKRRGNYRARVNWREWIVPVAAWKCWGNGWTGKRREQDWKPVAKDEKKSPLTRRQSCHLSGYRSLKCTPTARNLWATKGVEKRYDFVNGNMHFVI